MHQAAVHEFVERLQALRQRYLTQPIAGKTTGGAIKRKEPDELDMEGMGRDVNALANFIVTKYDLQHDDATLERLYKEGFAVMREVAGKNLNRDFRD